MALQLVLGPYLLEVALVKVVLCATHHCVGGVALGKPSPLKGDVRHGPGEQMREHPATLRHVLDQTDVLAERDKTLGDLGFSLDLHQCQ